jgi:hypothetical protein
MALRIATVADSIAGLTVTGLVLKDLDQVKAKMDTRQAALMPLPDFVTGFEMVRDSYGGANAKMTVSYTLNYRLFFKPAGTGRTMILEQLPGLVAMIAAIWDAVLAISTIAGCEDIIPLDVSTIGVVNDPGDNAWWGCDMAFRVKEFVN